MNLSYIYSGKFQKKGGIQNMDIISFSAITLIISIIILLMAASVIFCKQGFNTNPLFIPCIGLLIIIVYECTNIFVINNVEKTQPKTTIEYVQSIQNLETEYITYINENGEQKEIAVDKFNLDADKPYIEKRHYEWGFLFEDETIVHLKQ